MTTPDLTPDAEDILQVEDDTPAVKVVVEGPTRVQMLPRQLAGVRGLTVPDGPAKQLLAADPYRAVARIITSDKAILIGSSKQEVEGGQPGQIPIGTVVEFTASDELWGACLGGTTTTVTVIQERWANG